MSIPVYRYKNGGKELSPHSVLTLKEYGPRNLSQSFLKFLVYETTQNSSATLEHPPRDCTDQLKIEEARTSLQQLHALGTQFCHRVK